MAIPSQGPTLDTPSAAQVSDILAIIRHDYAVLAVLFILLMFSAASWGIIIYKKRQFRRASQQSAQFLEVFRRSSRFSEVQAVCASLGLSPLTGVFQAGFTELNAQLRGAGETKPGAPAARPTLKSLEAVDRALLRATTTEIAKLEHRIAFLATTASITPYIGLFGTVWGIMTAFIGIAGTGSTSLNVVAPGIAGALVTTAAGLFDAIPAVFFYNDLTTQVKGFVAAIEDFSMEFLNIAERNFT